MSKLPPPSPPGRPPEDAPERLEPFEYELLHSVAQRALRQMLHGAQDRSAFLAQMRAELAAVLDRHAGLAARRDLLFAELEAALLRLQAEPAPPAARPAAPPPPR